MSMPTEPHDGSRLTPARRTLLAVLAALFAAMLGYKVLHAGGLEQTALFYVGLPATIALVVAATARPRSATGLAVAVVTIGLALAGPLLDEGVICLVLAAPLFYLVAVVVGLAVDLGRKRAVTRRLNAFGLAPVLAVLCLHGVSTPAPHDDLVTVTRTVPGTPEQFATALAGSVGPGGPVDFRPPRSAFLSRLPFPRVVAVTGAGLQPGAERLITFNPRHSLGIGARPTPRAMRLRVTASAPGRARFDVVDDTATARWLRWDTSQVTWRPAPRGATEVTWQLGYRRTFDPGWYFGPLQRYGMRQAAGYLVSTFGAPAR